MAASHFFWTPMNAESIDATPTHANTETARIRELIQRGELASALAAAEALRAEAPENRDAIYMMAVCQRYLKRVPDALATLSSLERAHPHFPRLFQERGHCNVALRSPDEAIRAFERAVSLNHMLPASWRGLQALYRLTGRSADADRAAAEMARLAAVPPAIVTANGMFLDGDIVEAERIVREFLQTQDPLQIDAMWLLAKIGMKLNILDDAELLLESVLAINPDHHVARHDYVITLAMRHRHVRAMQEVEKLLEASPTNRAYRTTRAAIWMGLGKHDKALPLYRQVLAETPQDPDLHLSIAHALKTLNRTEEAIASYRAAAAIRPSYGEAYWSFANLKKYHFSNDEIARMRIEESAPLVNPADRYHLCFALGKALEDRAEYAESFAYYERGNALKKADCRYKAASIEYNTRLLIATCTNEFFATRQGYGHDSSAPIFIVGLPRSGSTLLEQILSSHSLVEGTMELADIPRLVQRLQGRDNYDSYKQFWDQYIGVFTSRSAAEFARDGENYIADTRVYRENGRPFFIDKNPNNFRNIGLIQLMLPNAKIIDARRGAMACCFSNFKQLFATGQEFTYSLEDLGSYYRWYVELMQHWDEVLPGKVLQIRHEDVVENIEANVRRILGFCELEFEPACLEFHKTQRRIHTVSSEQVRRPINKDGVDQWRNFEPWLEPLKIALGPLASS
jgi:tetratricopeptide (TPR) repeat protein